MCFSSLICKVKDQSRNLPWLHLFLHVISHSLVPLSNLQTSICTSCYAPGRQPGFLDVHQLCLFLQLQQLTRNVGVELATNLEMILTDWPCEGWHITALTLRCYISGATVHLFLPLSSPESSPEHYIPIELVKRKLCQSTCNAGIGIGPSIYFYKGKYAITWGGRDGQVPRACCPPPALSKQQTAGWKWTSQNTSRKAPEKWYLRLTSIAIHIYAHAHEHKCLTEVSDVLASRSALSSGPLRPNCLSTPVLFKATSYKSSH